MKTCERHTITMLLTSFLLFAGYTISISEDDAREPLAGWDTVVVAPMAKISIVGGDHTDTDAEEVVVRFLRILEDRGIRSRKATPDDERFLVLSMRVMTGPDAPFLLRLLHQEPVRYLRDDDQGVATATTWECETLSNYDRAFSTPWPKIEDAMEHLTDDLDAAIHGHPNKPPAEQGDDAN